MVPTSQLSAHLLDRKLVKSIKTSKNFFSLVVMAIVDVAARFMWISAGFPGKPHDSIIFQFTPSYEVISRKRFKEHSRNRYLFHDSRRFSFPFRICLTKPYSNAVLCAKQRFFNYLRSRARVVS